MAFGQHLILQEFTLQPSTEHLPPFDGWLMGRVAAGFGYWLQYDLGACQLANGDVFVATRVADGRLRASQLDPLKLQYFTVQPRHLEGLLTVVEWYHHEVALRQPPVPVRFFKSTDSIGQKFARLVNLSHTEKLPLRCALLQLWAAATVDSSAPEEIPADDNNKLRTRFWWLLNRMTRMELCLTSPLELARQINCSERHFRGLFRKELGVSMRSYQSSLRLNPDPQSPPDELPKTGALHCGGRRRTRRFSLPGEKSILSHVPEDPDETRTSDAAPAIQDSHANGKTFRADSD